jgi:hypothetical protein
MKFPILFSAPTFFFLLSALLVSSGHGASVSPVSELPGEEVVLLPGGGYTTPSEQANRDIDSVRHQERVRNDAKVPGKKRSRARTLNEIASTGPGE